MEAFVMVLPLPKMRREQAHKVETLATFRRPLLQNMVFPKYIKSDGGSDVQRKVEGTWSLVKSCLGDNWHLFPYGKWKGGLSRGTLIYWKKAMIWKVRERLQRICIGNVEVERWSSLWWSDVLIVSLWLVIMTICASNNAMQLTYVVKLCAYITISGASQCWNTFVLKISHSFDLIKCFYIVL